jgi:pyridoxine 5-phosphate synthase
MRLGVNIDHIATLREVRGGIEPEPILAALICQMAQADSIVVHLREDRRHIKEKDLLLLRKSVKTKLNLEMSIANNIVAIACKIKPDQATLVPEKRRELTTEGGLDVITHFKKIKAVVAKLENRGIPVSLFIDPKRKQIDAAKKVGASMIELHTGHYAEAKTKATQSKFFKELAIAVAYAQKQGLIVNAGHGLNYYNTHKIAKIKGIEELNIGYSIISRAIFSGLKSAVKEMKALL